MFPFKNDTLKPVQELPGAERNKSGGGQLIKSAAEHHNALETVFRGEVQVSLDSN